MTNRTKIMVSLGLVFGLGLLAALMNMLGKSRSLINKAVGSGEVGMKFEGVSQVNKGGQFKETLTAYSIAGSRPFAGVQANIYGDPKVAIRDIRCLRPFDTMVWKEIVLAGANRDQQIARIMCVANTAQIVGTSGVPFAEIDLIAGQVDGEAVLAFNDNGIALAGGAADGETRDISAAGIAYTIRIGSGINPQTPTTDPAGADLRADPITYVHSGSTILNCYTFSFPVTNVGQQAIDSFNVKLYIDPQPAPPTASTVASADLSYSGGLASGQKYIFTQERCAIDPAVVHTVYSFVDPSNQVREPNENNNIASTVIGIQPTNTPTATTTPKPTGGACVAEGYSCTKYPDNCCGTLNCKSMFANNLDPVCMRCDGTCQNGNSCPSGYAGIVGSCGYNMSCCVVAGVTLTPTPTVTRTPTRPTATPTATRTYCELVVGLQECVAGVNKVLIPTCNDECSFGFPIRCKVMNNGKYVVACAVNAPSPTPTATRTPTPACAELGRSCSAAVVCCSGLNCSSGICRSGGDVCPRGSLGNLNCSADGKIDVYDLVLMISEYIWQKPAPTLPFAQIPALKHTPDISGSDGIVNSLDLARLLMYWTRN